MQLMLPVSVLSRRFCGCIHGFCCQTRTSVAWRDELHGVGQACVQLALSGLNAADDGFGLASAKNPNVCALPSDSQPIVKPLFSAP